MEDVLASLADAAGGRCEDGKCRIDCFVHPTPGVAGFPSLAIGGSDLFGGEERLEDAGLDGRVHAVAGVADGEDDVLARWAVGVGRGRPEVLRRPRLWPTAVGQARRQSLSCERQARVERKWQRFPA